MTDHPEFDFNAYKLPLGFTPGGERLKLVHTPRARNSDPQSSHDAVESCNWGKVAQTVLEVIESFGPEGCISADILAALPHIGYGSITPMYKVLLRNGVIQDAGYTRLAPSNRQQRVMVATIYATK